MQNSIINSKRFVCARKRNFAAAGFLENVLLNAVVLVLKISIEYTFSSNHTHPRVRISACMFAYAKEQLCFVYMLANTELWLGSALPIVVGLSSYVHALLYSIIFYVIFLFLHL